MIVINKDILFLPPWLGWIWTWTKTKFRVVLILRHPVDNWTVRKHSKKIFWDDGGLCRVLKTWIFIILIWGFKVRGKSSWLWTRVSEYWIALRTEEKWASLLYSSFCIAKTRMSLCQTCVRHWRNRSCLSGSSDSWSSNLCAALVTGLAMRSTVNKGTLCTSWLAFGLTAEVA